MLTTLFERILETFADTDEFIKEESPTFFLVYAHENASAGKANAALARNLIRWLTVLRSKVLSDRSTSLGPWWTRGDGNFHRDILWNQFCLLPESGKAGSVHNISSVDKVILCCSEVLQSYHEDSRMKEYTEAIKNFYRDPNRDITNTDEVKKGIEGIVKEYCGKEGFHHVLTELAFLEIRCIQQEKQHGIVPVVLDDDSITIPGFLDIGVPLRLKPQKPSQSMIHECEVLHRLLFNLLGQLYQNRTVSIEEFKECYRKLVEKLSLQSSVPSLEEFEISISAEIKLAVDRLIRRGLATHRTG